MGFMLCHCSSHDVFLCQYPPNTLMVSLFISLSLLSHAWFILSFASVEQPPLAHMLEKLGFSSLALWLTNDFVKRDMVSHSKKRNRNWILASVGSLICHLFNIDVHYVYGLFGCLLYSGPARPVRSATWGSVPVDNVTLIDGFHSLIVSTV